MAGARPRGGLRLLLLLAGAAALPVCSGDGGLAPDAAVLSDTADSGAPGRDAPGGDSPVDTADGDAPGRDAPGGDTPVDTAPRPDARADSGAPRDAHGDTRPDTAGPPDTAVLPETTDSAGPGPDAPADGGALPDSADTGADSADGGPGDTLPGDVTPPPLEGLGGHCVTLRTGELRLGATSETAFAFGSEAAVAARFYLQPADLTTYLLYDSDRGYLLADGGPLLRATVLESDVTRVEDGYISGAEWVFEAHPRESGRYRLRNRRSGQWLGREGLAATGVAVALEPATGCTAHPEASLDAHGTVSRTTFEDGTLFGIADAHSHLLTNFSFGGGIFHGGTFHRLGVAHALPDCAMVHGTEGRHDFFGHVYDGGGNDAAGVLGLLDAFLAGELAEWNHDTAGWPDFPDWPNARLRSTHQVQYYRWLERAWLGGLRLVVQLATSDYVICSLMVAEGIQPSRYDCEDMTSVDRIIDETWAMERYIDAQAGGTGLGFFRIVQTPAEAREVITAGKLAVVLGIETSNLFRCHLTPRAGGPVCDEAYVEAQLDAYHARGIRSVFPVHKYDNRFSPGDGSRDFIELGNFFNSGHWSNFSQNCPSDGMPRGWDGGRVSFGGLNQPRVDYLAEAPNDVSSFAVHPAATAFLYYNEISQGPLDGEWCQNATLSPVGEALFSGLMRRGMIVEVDHLPQWSYRRAFEILQASDYPAAGTHGRHWDGRTFALGGISSFGLDRCQDPDNPGSTLRGLAERVALIVSQGGYPGVPFGFDLNGFAGAPGPRFAPGACGKPQPHPITYPFASYAGDVEFTAPFLGNRAVDFNTEGMVHIGLLPELLQDARADAGDDADLEPLFRSAEAYVRMWEKAERRAAELRAGR